MIVAFTTTPTIAGAEKCALGGRAGEPARIECPRSREAGIAELMLCPKCGKGHMIAVMIIEPEPGFNSAFKLDSS